MAHGFAPAEGVAPTGGVVHGPLGVVHGSRHLADEGELDVVLHLVPRGGGPLELFQPRNPFEVESVGVGAVEARGLESPVEVDKEMIFGAHGGGAVVEIGDKLVVAVHEVDFEAFDAQFPPKEKKKLPGQLF